MNKKLSIILILLILCFCSLVHGESSYISIPSNVVAGQAATYVYTGTFNGAAFEVGNYSWNFGDNTTVYTNIATITHTYANAGNYNISFRLYAVPNVGSLWNVSSDWSQLLYSENDTVTVTTGGISGDDAVGIAVALFVVGIGVSFALIITFTRRRDTE